MQVVRRLDIRTCVAIGLVHLFVILSPVLFLGSHMSLATWVTVTLTILLGWLYTSPGVTVGFHRLETHHSFKCGPMVYWYFVIGGLASLQGTFKTWRERHLEHHRKSDQPGDPHSPVSTGSFWNRIGAFWYAHMGWLLVKRPSIPQPLQVRLLATLVVTIGITIPCMVLLFMMGPMGILMGLTASAIRIFIVWHFTWAINSVTHSFGERSFETPDNSRNSRICAILGWGEGWHNNHHAFPRSAFHGLGARQFDPSSWIIRKLERYRLAWDVVRYRSDYIASEAKKLKERANSNKRVYV